VIAWRLLAALLLLAGCSQALTFSKPGASDEQQARDRYACMQESRVGSVVGGEEKTLVQGQNRLAQREANRLFEACMTVRGYRRSN
jgi:hypothetical protein